MFFSNLLLLASVLVDFEILSKLFLILAILSFIYSFNTGFEIDKKIFGQFKNFDVIKVSSVFTIIICALVLSLNPASFISVGIISFIVLFLIIALRIDYKIHLYITISFIVLASVLNILGLKIFADFVSVYMYFFAIFAVVCALFLIDNKVEND